MPVNAALNAILFMTFWIAAKPAILQSNIAGGPANQSVNPLADVAATSDELVMPQGTPVCLLSSLRMSTRTAHPAERVLFRVGKDVSIGGMTVVAKNTSVWGTVTDVARPGRGTHSARLSFSFENLMVAGNNVAVLEPPQPKESPGSLVKDTWEIGGPWLIPVVPLEYLTPNEEELLTKGTCRWVFTATAVQFNKSNLMAAPSSHPVAEIDQYKPAESQGSQLSITEITVGFGPRDIAFTPGAVWISWGDADEAGLTRIDPATGKTIDTMPIHKQAGADQLGNALEWLPPYAPPLAAGNGAVWVGNGEKFISRIDPVTDQVVATVTVGEHVQRLTAGDGDVWVIRWNDRFVSRIDATSNRVIAKIRVKKQPVDIAWGDGSVWVLHESGISRIDPVKNAVIRDLHLWDRVPTLYFRPHLQVTRLIAEKGNLWVTADDETVLRIDASSGKIKGRIKLPRNKDFFTGKIRDGQPLGLAALNGFIWVTDWTNETLWKIDSLTGNVTPNAVPAGFHPDIRGPGNDGNGNLWISNAADGTVMKVRP